MSRMNLKNVEGIYKKICFEDKLELCSYFLDHVTSKGEPYPIPTLIIVTIGINVTKNKIQIKIIVHHAHWWLVIQLTLLLMLWLFFLLINQFMPTILHDRCHEMNRKLTLPMLRLLSFKAQGYKYFWKPTKPFHVGIHWIALAECSQMSTHLPGFQVVISFFVSFCICQISHQLLKG